MNIETPYPKRLAVEAVYEDAVKRVKVDRWISRDYHDREVERIWKKVWQVACRQDDIPNVGDYIVYDIAHLSFIVMHSAEHEYRAYWNSCPHRARKLKEFDGHGVSELRCMYHGWAWNIDGSVKDIACKWDFPGTDGETALVQAKADILGGFVFINPDPDCLSLQDYLGPIADQYENAGNDMAKRWKQVHVGAVLDCNWKVAQEAFLEGWHVATTHPQLVFALDDRRQSAGRWDDFGHFMRVAPSLPTDVQPARPTWATLTDAPQEAVDSYYDRHLNQPPTIIVEEGETAIDVIKRNAREFLRAVIGDKIADYHDVELLGGDMVSVFPNLHPWGGLSRICYRYRPYGDNPDQCIMEVMLLSPWPEDQPKPPPAKTHWLKPGETTLDAPELGQLCRIFMQDLANMPYVQKGLKTNPLGYVILSERNEAPIRHLHDLYETWMGLADGE